MITKEKILEILENVADPEVPVLSVLDLGIIREIKINQNNIEIFITPTYSGCPAMQTIATNIKFELIANGIDNVVVKEILSPSWTTDWMTENGKKKLQEYGIAPPQYDENKKGLDENIECPQCHSINTKLLSQFGSTACKALYKCLDCLEPFDYFKCH
ncbi:MAG: phenylacetate-CoA oxygenase subunit PaaJ [Chitinophagaceae bacterium]|nr:phenylacetate-CoA oxygenase subunit PaaJ [Chitinophagaceae bacterium]